MPFPLHANFYFNALDAPAGKGTDGLRGRARSGTSNWFSRRTLGQPEGCADKALLERGESYTPRSSMDVRCNAYLELAFEGAFKACVQRERVMIWRGRGERGVEKAARRLEVKVKFSDDEGRKLRLQLRYERCAGRPTVISVYATHWIVNHTKLKLQVRSPSIRTVKLPG